MTLLLAAATGEKAFESHSLKAGLYTQTLVGLLENKADDGSGNPTAIDFNALGEEASRKMADLAKREYGLDLNPALLSAATSASTYSEGDDALSGF